MKNTGDFLRSTLLAMFSFISTNDATNNHYLKEVDDKIVNISNILKQLESLKTEIAAIKDRLLQRFDFKLEKNVKNYIDNLQEKFIYIEEEINRLLPLLIDEQINEPNNLKTKEIIKISISRVLDENPESFNMEEFYEESPLEDATYLIKYSEKCINEFNKLNQGLKMYEEEAQAYKSNLNCCTITLSWCDEHLEKFKNKLNMLLKNPSLKQYAKNKDFANLIKKIEDKQNNIKTWLSSLEKEKSLPAGSYYERQDKFDEVSQWSYETFQYTISLNNQLKIYTRECENIDYRRN